jgi:hypothetical protein
LAPASPLVPPLRTWIAVALDARAYAGGGSTHADAGASRARAYATKEKAVWWSQHK